MSPSRRSAGWRKRRWARSRCAQVLGALVEIMVAAGECDVARAAPAADELLVIAREVDIAYRLHWPPTLRCGVPGGGRSASALPELRKAWGAWRELGAPHEAAKVRVLLGLACRAVGDADTASMELDAARLAFAALGAASEVVRVETAAPQ